MKWYASVAHNNNNKGEKPSYTNDHNKGALR